MSRYTMCPNCGRRMRREYDEWGTTYICDYCASVDDDDDDDDDNNSERLDVYDAALIWASHGKDEDYTCGYSEDELEDALR